MIRRDWKFEVMRRGEVIASVISPDRGAAYREIVYCASQFAEDGIVTIREHVPRLAHGEQARKDE